MALDQIAYEHERDKGRVLAWLEGRGVEARPGPGATIAIKAADRIRYADVGDTIAFDGYAVEIVHKGDSE